MEPGSTRKDTELAPRRGGKERPEVERPSGWDPEETVALRAGSERKEAAERAERLRLVTGQRRFGRR
jgi:hypothetical protein